MNRMSAPVPCLSLLSLFAACTAPSRAGEEPAGARMLDGLWAVEFIVETPLRPGHPPPQRSVRGEVALLHDSALHPRPTGLSGPPTHSGSYTTRFRPLGFEVRETGAVPALLARLSPADSVEIALQPDHEDPLLMRGSLAGDSIAGRWSYYQRRGGAASGSFVMRRR